MDYKEEFTQLIEENRLDDARILLEKHKLYASESSHPAGLPSSYHAAQSYSQHDERPSLHHFFFLKNDLFEQFCIDWVQSTERLIQDNQVWLMNQSNDELNLLLISF